MGVTEEDYTSLEETIITSRSGLDRPVTVVRVVRIAYAMS